MHSPDEPLHQSSWVPNSLTSKMHIKINMQKQIRIQDKIQNQINIDITTTKNKTKKKEKEKQNVDISHNSSCKKCPTNSCFPKRSDIL